MDSTPEPPPARPAVSRVRTALLLVLIFGVLLPSSWVAGIILFGYAVRLLSLSLPLGSDSPLMLAMGVPALGLTLAVARRAVRRGWAARNRHFVGWGLAGAGLALLALAALERQKNTTLRKVVEGNFRQLGAALDQYYLEYPHRFFVAYDELVGPDRYIRSLNSVRGEDYRVLFPADRYRRRFQQAITLPNGLNVVDTYDRVAPPSPPDGVQAESDPNGEKFETTWRGGARHGRFRAWRADGSLWSEAEFVQGRIAGPCWLYLRDGSRFDELDPAQHPDAIARRKLAAGDLPGALREFSRMLDAQAPDYDPGLLQERSAVQEKLGDLPAVIADLELLRAYYVKRRMQREIAPVDERLAALRGKLK